ncbi:type II toxin-antitoxin system HigB family toxin [Thiohalocapsa sp. ML1]|uniref:type II toxin-antitoxin system HigB family toxin n=1 Tax=Thiohalocapsa sp. ML1 TaxID=1431688 RepID=UPI001C1F6C97
MRSVRPAHEAAVAAETPARVKAQFRNASILGNRRVVFSIKGNSYRLITAIAYTPASFSSNSLARTRSTTASTPSTSSGGEHRGHSADPNRDRLRGSP